MARKEDGKRAILLYFNWRGTYALDNVFKNVCKDGGMHIGLEADGVLLFDDLQEGPCEPDPALDWYLDLPCETKKVPDSSENIRNWLLGSARHQWGVE